MIYYIGKILCKCGYALIKRSTGKMYRKKEISLDTQRLVVLHLHHSKCHFKKAAASLKRGGKSNG